MSTNRVAAPRRHEHSINSSRSQNSPLHFFSTESQLSFKTTNEYRLTLASEFQFKQENIECFRKLFRKLGLSNKKDYYKSISENVIIPGSEQFFPILFTLFAVFVLPFLLLMFSVRHGVRTGVWTDMVARAPLDNCSHPEARI